MRMSFLKLFAAASLLLVGVVSAQSDTTSNATVATEADFQNLFIYVAQYESNFERFACALEDDGHEFFEKPEPCDSQTNSTNCMKSCCPTAEYNEYHDTNFPACVKKQPLKYINEKMNDLQLISPGDYNRGTKQITTLTGVAAAIFQCAENPSQRCILNTTPSAALLIAELIENATRAAGTVAGDTARRTINLLGIEFIRALFASSLITNEQRLLLIALLQTPPVVPVVPVVPVNPTPARCFWYPWGGWSNCQGVCGVGVQSRIRRCQGCVPGTGACQGACTQKRGCANPVGQICGYWGGWSAYGPCSASCGIGSRTRSRPCHGGSVGNPGCIGEQFQSIVCNNGPNNNGRYLPWTQWSQCTASCGEGGTQARSRGHTCLTTQTEVRTTCSPAPPSCCGKLSWTRWTTCSVSCGMGVRTRRRPDVCPIPDEIQTQVCDQGSGSWLQWMPFGPCSSTCSDGRRDRVRTHSCLNSRETESVPCGRPGGFGQWSTWGDCSSSCPGGTQRRSRRHSCTNQVEEEYAPCPPRDPVYSDWTDYGSCSSTCRGRRVRQQFEACGGPPIQETEGCGTDDLLSSWSEWSVCSTLCFNDRGIQSRTRQNVCTGETEDQSQRCGVAGSWGEYSDWTACTGSCGTGTRARTRTHSCDRQPPPSTDYQTETQTESCPLQPCCFWREWGSWSDCPATCGYDIVTRTRTNSCPSVAEESQRKFCFVNPGLFLPWSNWGPCSRTCPGGQRRRSRRVTCRDEPDIQPQTCGTSSWSRWSPWSACSATCGGGLQSRSRTDPCESPIPDRQSRPCNTNPGVYNPPSPWTPCSSSCAPGRRTRVSTHTCGLVDRIETEACGIQGTWRQWNQWSFCSSSCLGGTRTRIRNHECTNAIEEVTEACGSAGSPLSWSTWTVCSQLCAGGTRTRTRGHTCRAAEVQTEECGRAPFYGQWSFYGGCSATCDGGTQSRTRQGFCGNQDQSQSRPCSTVACCYALPWGRWSPCSTTCGTGQQTRNMLENCTFTVIGTENRNCIAPVVDIPWTPWSPCPVTCGSSQQFRSKTDPCVEVPQGERRSCAAFPCPDWTAWTSWSVCSASCFAGNRVRTRRCLAGNVPSTACPGIDRESFPCNAGSGIYTSWTSWSACSTSCGVGTYSRRRSNTCGLEDEVETANCNNNFGTWNFWSQWSRCSATCGIGSRSRARTHSCRSDIDRITEQCVDIPATWNEWQSWSACTQTCGGGTYERRRSHTCGLDDETESSFCNTFEGVFLDWSPWSGCTVSCGTGSRRRSRPHTCGLQDDPQVELCSTNLCPYWTGWTSYSDCSVTCGVGSRTRTRECMNGRAGIDCIGSAFDSTLCSFPEDVFGEWTGYSSCSATCGGGIETRQRQNLCSNAIEFDNRPCNTNPGVYSPWTSWTQCSQTCGQGFTSRNRIHTCDQPPEAQTVGCVITRIEWSSWSAWSVCSARCGTTGLATRFRTQCNGTRDVQSQPCNRFPCAIWGGWGTWGPCSVTCGTGYTLRYRSCENGKPGDGYCFTSIVSDVDRTPCTLDACTCGNNWSGWSACCQGTSLPRRPALQFRYYVNTCGEPWQLFNRTCPPGVQINRPISCLANLDDLFEKGDLELEGGGLRPLRERIEQILA